MCLQRGAPDIHFLWYDKAFCLPIFVVIIGETLAVVAIKIFPAVKITGATHDRPVSTDPSDNVPLPDPCTSTSSKMPSMYDIEPTPLSPMSTDEEDELLTDELEFDKFLLDAAEWL